MRIEDQEAWIDFKANVTTKLSKEQYRLLCTLHARYLNHNFHEPCSCKPKLLVMWIKDLDNIYNNNVEQ